MLCLNHLPQQVACSNVPDAAKPLPKETHTTTTTNKPTHKNPNENTVATLLLHTDRIFQNKTLQHVTTIQNNQRNAKSTPLETNVEKVHVAQTIQVNMKRSLKRRT
jgi:hypothetical protein